MIRECIIIQTQRSSILSHHLPQQAIKKVQELSDRYFPVSHGFRNSNLFRFACKLHDYGVSKDDALMYLMLRYVEPDFDGIEIESIINSAYH